MIELQHAAHSPSARRRAFRLLPVLLVLFVTTACERADAPSEPAAMGWQQASGNGLYHVRIEPRDGDVLIGDYHEWVLTLTDTDGDAVFPARIQMGGGMPGHGHGLPTQPQITDHLGDGRYRIEGVRFNMAGAWVLSYRIGSALGTDDVRFEIDLTF
ncbi:MAG: FixH family protein [Pseudomonadota bacterium]